MTFTRITIDANHLGGAPCIRGLRIPVATIVDMVDDGMTGAQILERYPELTASDVLEALEYELHRIQTMNAQIEAAIAAADGVGPATRR